MAYFDPRCKLAEWHILIQGAIWRGMAYFDSVHLQGLCIEKSVIFSPKFARMEEGGCQEGGIIPSPNYDKIPMVGV